MFLLSSKFFSLILWIVSFEGIGFLIGKSVKYNKEWYQHLSKSPLTPPDFYFGLAWGFLYCVLAFIGWFLWTSANKIEAIDTNTKKNCSWKDEEKNLTTIKILFLFQMLSNWLWTPLFFIFHHIKLSFFCVLFMIFLTLSMMKKSFSCYKKIFYCFVPYVLWLFFAAYLNGYLCFS